MDNDTEFGSDLRTRLVRSAFYLFGNENKLRWKNMQNKTALECKCGFDIEEE